MITLAMIAVLAMPPKQFDHAPTQPYTIVLVSAQQIDDKCKSLSVLLSRLEGKKVMVFACTVGEGMDLIYIRNDLTAKARAKVLRHEYGHVNGWVHG